MPRVTCQGCYAKLLILRHAFYLYVPETTCSNSPDFSTSTRKRLIGKPKRVIKCGLSDKILSSPSSSKNLEENYFGPEKGPRRNANYKAQRGRPTQHTEEPIGPSQKAKHPISTIGISSIIKSDQKNLCITHQVRRKHF